DAEPAERSPSRHGAEGLKPNAPRLAPPLQPRNRRNTMALIGHFDATNVAPSEDFSPIPVGEYSAHIVDSDVKPTKNNTGHYAELEFEVTAGEFKGRKVWARLNLDNPNPKAVEIAQRELSAICHAVGVLQVTDTQQLH